MFEEMQTNGSKQTKMFISANLLKRVEELMKRIPQTNNGVHLRMAE